MTWAGDRYSHLDPTSDIGARLQSQQGDLEHLKDQVLNYRQIYQWAGPHVGEKRFVGGPPSPMYRVSFGCETPGGGSASSFATGTNTALVDLNIPALTISTPPTAAARVYKFWVILEVSDDGGTSWFATDAFNLWGYFNLPHHHDRVKLEACAFLAVSGNDFTVTLQDLAAYTYAS